jgi:hypothetical protein
MPRARRPRLPIEERKSSPGQGQTVYGVHEILNCLVMLENQDTERKAKI